MLGLDQHEGKLWQNCLFNEPQIIIALICSWLKMNREPFPCCVLTVNLYGPHFETSHFNELKWGLSDFIFYLLLMCHVCVFGCVYCIWLQWTAWSQICETRPSSLFIGCVNVSSCVCVCMCTCPVLLTTADLIAFAVCFPSLLCWCYL